MLKQTKKLSGRVKIVIAALILLVIFDLSPAGGYAPMYIKWIQCGRKPLTEGPGIIGTVRHYASANSPKLYWGSPRYFCNEHEAELAGYSASPEEYSYPHLTDEEIRNIIR